MWIVKQKIKNEQNILKKPEQTPLTYFIKRSMTVQLTFCFTGTKKVNLLLIQHK